MYIKDRINFYTQKLKNYSDSYQLDVLLIFCFVLNKSKEELFLYDKEELSFLEDKRIGNLVNERKKGKPIAYIIQKKDFLDYSFFVNENVLIPRPETEELVEMVVKNIKENKTKDCLIVDVGSGSGCCIISLKLMLKDIENIDFWAIEKSKKAIQVLNKNLIKYKINHLVRVIWGDLLFSVKQEPLKKWKKIFFVVNLPYLSVDDYMGLSGDVLSEPKSALIADDSGLFLIKHLILEIDRLKISNNVEKVGFFEFDPKQENRMIEFVKNLNFDIIFLKDLSGKVRFFRINFDKKFHKTMN